MKVYHVYLFNIYLFQKIKKTCKSQCVIQDQQINNGEKKQTSKLPPLIAKLKPMTKVQNDRQSESDGNYNLIIIIFK